MKQLSIVAMGAVVALAACTDMDPAGLSADLALNSSHTWQSGNSNTWHGYHAPDVQFDASTGLLCATWDDDYLFERDSGQYPDTDFFSFDFYVDEDSDWLYLDDVRNSADTRTGCYDLSEWEDGAYLFRVNGMARHGTGQTTSTHHTEDWIDVVVIGAEWWIDVIGGSQQNLSHNANANNFTFSYHLYYGTTLIVDCDVAPDVAWAASVNQHNCDVDANRNLGSGEPG
jgi:hypothetical protein